MKIVFFGVLMVGSPNTESSHNHEGGEGVVFLVIAGAKLVYRNEIYLVRTWYAYLVRLPVTI